MKQHIISVGFAIPGDVVDSISFKSNSSLLDADVVVFSPDLSEYSSEDRYKGKPRLTDNDSALLVEHAQHWYRELTIALEAGKTVFLFMFGVLDLWIGTGEKEYSGTGRNTRVTNLVSPFDPYSSIPISKFLSVIQRRSGDRIKATRNIGVLAPYWHNFRECTSYQVYLQEPIGSPALVTQTGDKMVGGIVRFKGWRGVVVILPPPNLHGLVEMRSKQIRQVAKVKKGVAAPPSPAQYMKHLKDASQAVGAQFLGAIVEIDKAIRARSERTPPPSWAQSADYVLTEELSLRDSLEQIERHIAELRSEMVEVRSKLDAAGNLRGLIFETGRTLESAVLEALRLMQFKADRFVDSESEFDVVFEDPSGARLIGETEGKNDAAINIDKLSQLERNVQEDFEKREGATEYAKGVLFGNAFRLTAPAERADYFTHKCVTGAKRSGFALVRTPDLFYVGKYLREIQDPKFAAACRDAIMNTTGEIVIFPQPPSAAP